MSTRQTLTRIFRSGTMNLPDPNPTLSPKEVKDLYSVNYPQLTHADIENENNPLIEGDKMVYIFKMQPVKTKG